MQIWIAGHGGVLSHALCMQRGESCMTEDNLSVDCWRRGERILDWLKEPLPLPVRARSVIKGCVLVELSGRSTCTAQWAACRIWQQAAF